MKENQPRAKISFTVSESAESYLLKCLPDFVEKMSERGLVVILSWSGGGRMEKNGRVVWEYKGPKFAIGAHKPEALIDGTLYDLLGFPVWIRDFDNHLLKGRVLTASMVGSPEPKENLVIENAPEDYLKKFSQENAGDCPCCKPHVKQDV